MGKIPRHLSEGCNCIETKGAVKAVASLGPCASLSRFGGRPFVARPQSRKGAIPAQVLSYNRPTVRYSRQTQDTVPSWGQGQFIPQCNDRGLRFVPLSFYTVWWWIGREREREGGGEREREVEREREKREGEREREKEITLLHNTKDYRFSLGTHACRTTCSWKLSLDNAKLETSKSAIHQDFTT